MKKLFLTLMMTLCFSLYAESTPRLIIGVDMGFSNYRDQPMSKNAYIVYYDHDIKQENHSIEGLSIYDVFSLMLKQYDIENDYVVISTKSYSQTSHHFLKIDDDNYTLKTGSLPYKPTDPRFVVGMICIVAFVLLICMELANCFEYDVYGPIFSYGLAGGALICMGQVYSINLMYQIGEIFFFLLLLAFVENFLLEMRIIYLPSFWTSEIESYWKNYKKRQAAKLTDPYEKMLQAKKAYEKAAKEYEDSKEKVVWKTVKETK